MTAGFIHLCGCVLGGGRRAARDGNALVHSDATRAAQRDAARDGRDAYRDEPRVLDTIINEGTPTIGWIGPALLGILIAAFGWAGRVFEWLGTLAAWLFSGEWRE